MLSWDKAQCYCIAMHGIWRTFFKKIKKYIKSISRVYRNTYNSLVSEWSQKIFQSFRSIITRQWSLLHIPLIANLWMNWPLLFLLTSDTQIFNGSAQTLTQVGVALSFPPNGLALMCWLSAAFLLIIVSLLAKPFTSSLIGLWQARLILVEKPNFPVDCHHPGENECRESRGLDWVSM